MAELFLARADGIERFTKLVALERIRPSRSVPAIFILLLVLAIAAAWLVLFQRRRYAETPNLPAGSLLTPRTRFSRMMRGWRATIRREH